MTKRGWDLSSNISFYLRVFCFIFSPFYFSLSSPWMKYCFLGFFLVLQRTFSPNWFVTVITAKILQRVVRDFFAQHSFFLFWWCKQTNFPIIKLTLFITLFKTLFSNQHSLLFQNQNSTFSRTNCTFKDPTCINVGRPYWWRIGLQYPYGCQQR